jgi:hypothetical protein
MQVFTYKKISKKKFYVVTYMWATLLSYSFLIQVEKKKKYY